MVSGTLHRVLTDRASNVIRVGPHRRELGTGAQTFFDDDVKSIGFAGRDPFSIGQRNVHPSYITGKGGEGLNTRDPHLRRSTSRSATSCPACGRRAHVQVRRRHQLQPVAAARRRSARARSSSASDAPYNPADPSTLPVPVRHHRRAARRRRLRRSPRRIAATTSSLEDKWRVSNNLTLNLGLRYDHQQQTPASKRRLRAARSASPGT